MGEVEGRGEILAGASLEGGGGDAEGAGDDFKRIGAGQGAGLGGSGDHDAGENDGGEYTDAPDYGAPAVAAADHFTPP